MTSNRDRINVNEHVEFVVKAAEDLILEGKERTIVRVRADTPYSCLMLKNQRFSSLFRHYARHHGLRKEDLTYSFTGPLQDEDTPESVFLQQRDEVIVRKRRPSESNTIQSSAEDEENVSNEKYIQQISYLLDNQESCDVNIFCGQDKAEVKAHKAILVARSDYFRNMFRPNSLKEGTTYEIVFPDHDAQTVRWMIEYIYTNRISDLHRCGAEGLCSVLSIAEEFILTDLTRQCESAAKCVLSSSNVARFLLASEQFHSANLKDGCMQFIQKNLIECIHNQIFCNDICANPKLFIQILKSLSCLERKINPYGGYAYTNGFQTSNSGRVYKRRRVDIEVDTEEDRR
mmetsp:Transcript_20304/g.30010  ORF Transcript_20304/g.30010 Transcript_20304/m.30010 type:complete len:345 (+) Transcript_20304:128-1162(+)